MMRCTLRYYLRPAARPLQAFCQPGTDPRLAGQDCHLELPGMIHALCNLVAGAKMIIPGLTTASMEQRSLPSISKNNRLPKSSIPSPVRMTCHRLERENQSDDFRRQGDLSGAARRHGISVGRLPELPSQAEFLGPPAGRCATSRGRARRRRREG